MEITSFNRTFSENLKRYLDINKMTQSDLAKKLNVSVTSVNNWCTGLKSPRMDKVDRMCEIFRCSRSDLVEPYESRPLHGRMKDDHLEPVDLSDYVMIPVYGRIPAGAPKLEEEFIEDRIPIPRSWTIGGIEYGGLTVKGESMLPLIQDGDTVVYRHQPTVENGSICIARVDHYDATVKKFVQHDSRTIVLQPLNSEYDPIIFTGDSSEPPLEIIGKVVEVRHAL